MLKLMGKKIFTSFTEFFCLSKPVLEITNISNRNMIPTSSCTLFITVTMIPTDQQQ